MPGKAGVLIAPSTDCRACDVEHGRPDSAVVHLSEFPPFVLTVADVEICHLERVQFGLKNFDVVFVLHDFTKAPLHINTVPSTWLVHRFPLTSQCRNSTTSRTGSTASTCPTPRDPST